jgi:hypothetical protein
MQVSVLWPSSAPFEVGGILNLWQGGTFLVDCVPWKEQMASVFVLPLLWLIAFVFCLSLFWPDASFVVQLLYFFDPVEPGLGK